MKRSILGLIIGFVIGFMLVFIIYGIIKCTDTVILNAITSSHVEEMYHKKSVMIIDSILNSRYSSYCCEEVIDSDDISVPHDSLGRVQLPKNW